MPDTAVMRHKIQVYRQIATISPTGADSGPDSDSSLQFPTRPCTYNMKDKEITDAMLKVKTDTDYSNMLCHFMYYLYRGQQT